METKSTRQQRIASLKANTAAFRQALTKLEQSENAMLIRSRLPELKATLTDLESEADRLQAA